VIISRNEERSISNTLKSALELDYPIFDVILVDGGSDDQTLEIAHSLSTHPNGKNLKIIPSDDSSPGQGRNTGVEHSSSEIIAFLDGDCYPKKEWLRNAVPLLLSDGVGGVGGPRVTSHRSSYLSRAFLESLAYSFASWGSPVFSKVKDTKEVENIGGVGVYKKVALKKAGLYSEDLIFCEDVDLDRRVRKAGFRLIVSPDVVVEHDWKVRSVRSLFKHMVKYGQGRSNAIKKKNGLFSPRYMAPSIALVFALLLLPISLFFGGIPLLFTELVFSFTGLLLIIASIFVAYDRKDPRMLIIAPITWLITQIGYGFGFLLGLVRGRDTLP
jgi:cellulose synthase/poly-beta-1,6-N-acetylglucosamine synthase-like glycosyltransferase